MRFPRRGFNESDLSAPFGMEADDQLTLPHLDFINGQIRRHPG